MPRSGRCGQTLSGGLDSRSILAEAAPLCPEWAAVSYGIPNSDDVQIAKRAAEASGVAWSYHDPYMSEPHWLESRTSFVQQTDGLIDLTDLMHVASVQAQALQLDVHFSGYIGDAVCGPTFTDVENTMDLKSALPFYATRLGMDQVGAERRIEEIVAGLSGAPPRFALFEHKIPQSTNRWVDAWRPWLAVRRPFLDYNLFDFWQGLPVALRREGRLYERWLKHRFPELKPPRRRPRKASERSRIRKTWSPFSAPNDPESERHGPRSQLTFAPPDRAHRSLCGTQSARDVECEDTFTRLSR